MKKIIGLVGEIASGKGTVSAYLQDKYGAKTYRFSDVMREILSLLNLECNRENLSNLSLTLRQTFGEDVFSIAMAKKVFDDKNDLIILDGIRRKEDLGSLNKIEGFKLVYLEADMKTRYERIVKRGENTDDKIKTFEDFEKDHLRDTELRIKDLKNYADFVIDCNGTPEEVFVQIDKILE